VVSIVNGMRQSRRSYGRYGAVALVVVVALIAWLLLAKRAPAKPATTAVAADATLELAPADVAIVSLKPLARTLPLSGSVQPVNQATVKSKVSGEVLEMTVREGEAVKRGGLLARIDTRNAGANRDAAQAALEKARADMAIAKLNYGNSVKLQEQQFVSQNAVDSTKAIYDAAAANTKSAEANLRLSSNALEDATVRAPFDGVVAMRGVQVGEKVSPDTSIFTLVDLSKMELDAPAPTSEIPSVKVGQTARFRVDGFGDRDFIGTVWRVNPVAEQGSRSIMIYLSVPNDDSALKGGMFAQGELALDAGTPVPSVPLTAIRDEGGVPFVWVVDKGVIQRRGVTLGLKAPSEGLVEIRDGLKPDEQVVTARIDTLKDGAKVTVGSPSAVEAAKPAGTR
jgi:RND family efflux transporter MFP subunit